MVPGIGAVRRAPQGAGDEGSSSGTRVADMSRCAVGPPMSSPKFGGESGEGLFSRFAADFVTFAAMYAWTDEFKLHFLPLCLTGVARDAFDSLSEAQRGEFKSAISGLRDLFAKPNSLDAHAELGKLRFDPRKPLDSFVIRFNLLIKRAFPGQDLDTVKFNHFLSTLPEAYQTEVISTGSFFFLISFSQTVEKIRNMCRAEKRRAAAAGGAEAEAATVRRVESESGTQSMLSQILDRIGELEKQVERQSQARVNAGSLPRRGAFRGTSGQGPPSRACYVCGSPGHLAAACRNRGRACYGCGQVGHLAAVCPFRTGNDVGPDPGTGPGSRDPQRTKLPQGQRKRQLRRLTLRQLLILFL